MQVLIIDDEVDILSTLIDQLSLHNITADCAYNGQQGAHLALENHYDVIVLDVMMPKQDGLQTCRELRAAGCSVPIIFLTARDTLEDKIAGFEAGGDDYLIKPFAMDELLCRVQALAKRISRQGLSSLSYGSIEMNLETLKVHREGVAVNLNQIQFKLLQCLISHAPKVLSRAQLEATVWQQNPPDSDALRSHMYQLRKVLDKPFDFEMVENVRGRGYRLLKE